jgi:predicted ATP-dependent endonuclease of OLD family
VGTIVKPLTVTTVHAKRLPLNQGAALFIIDEPDIYLHSDLQRQLVSALRTLGPDILIATHSTEIISEADPHEILIVTKKARSAKRVGDPSQLHAIFDVLGSNLNPFLTQLARSRRLVFVEGKDFLVVARFATKLGVTSVAMRSNFAVFPTEGFNPTRAKSFREGVEATLGSTVEVAVVFDRDYRSDSEVEVELREIRTFSSYAHIHSKKELENFALVPAAIERAIVKRLAEQNRRTGQELVFAESAVDLLASITNDMKHDVLAQYLKKQHPFSKATNKALDDTTITSGILATFEERWKNLEQRLDLAPGKRVLANLNTRLQESYGLSITINLIIEVMKESEIPQEMKELVASLNDFARDDDR